MRKIHSIYAAMAIVSVASLAPSCTGIETDRRSEGPVTVAFTTAQSDTRAELDPSAGRFTWEIGDKVAVWADSQTGSAVLEAKEFTLLSRANHSKGYFTSTLDAPMEEGTYNYYIAFPVPTSFTGKDAVFNLQSEQNGKASGACIAVSGAMAAGALREFDETRPVSETISLNLGLRHLLHYLRFYIPAGENAMNEPVSSLEFSMPQGIAGTVNVNVGTGEATLTDAKTAVTLTPESPVQDGEFISASIFPPQTTYVNDEFLNVRVFSENWYSDIEPIRLEGRNFQAGHITTVPLRAKTASPIYNLSFTLISNNLGQDVNSVTFTFDNEVTWGGSKITAITYTEPDGTAFIPGEKIVFKTFEESEFRALSGTGFTVTYESADAIVSENLTFPDMSTASSTNVELNCPYLMFEDFSCIQSSFNSGDKYSTSNAGSKSPYYIESGWSVARAGGEAGTAIRLAARREAVACYHSRCDSPLLSGIKDGHTVNISLTFNYSMNRQEGGVGSKPKLGANINIGWTTETGDLNSGSEAGTFPDSFYANEDTGSYTNIGNEHSTKLEGITNAMRLSIRELAETKADMTNGAYWLYLDNIRVQIANN